jgi:hypothetical protein
MEEKREELKSELKSNRKSEGLIIDKTIFLREYPAAILKPIVAWHSFENKRMFDVAI